MRNISVRSRFYLVMTLVSLSLSVLAIWSLVATRGSISTVTDLFDQADRAAQQVAVLRESTASMRRYQAEMIAASVSNPTDVGHLHDAWKKSVATIAAGADSLARSNPGDAAMAALLEKQKKTLGEVRDFIEPVATQLQDAKMDASAGLAYAQQADEKLDALQAGMNELQKMQQQDLAAIRATIGTSATLASVARLVLVGITLAIFLPLMWITLRSICGPLDEAVHVASRIAGGDLSATVRVEGKDEPARLMRALSDMQDALRRLVGQVRESSESIEVASAEVASGNFDLSQRTELAASNLQQTAGSMAQLTGGVRQSADSAHTANQLASSAAAVAARGGQVVSQVVSTMNEINTSSKKIADIIGVIDGIAFQTNILALNAAVEAARAGEQGRGFAVVAGEVRSLAQRSAEAAKEIKSLIGTSVDKVETGSKLVQDAGSTMTEIVASVQRVTDIIAEISAAATEQSHGIGQVDTAITQLDHMTQQNAALVEESAAAAESLKEQAIKLAHVVSTFRLDPGQAAAPVAAPVPASASASGRSPIPAAPKPAHASAADHAIARAKAQASPPAARSPAPAPAPAPAPKPETPPAAPKADDGDWESF
jgi:methyl-accepting chemotaxis protein